MPQDLGLYGSTTDELRRTGATGYIGGDFLFELLRLYSDWKVTCLVRNEGKASQLLSAFPDIRIVQGDLDSSELIEREASKANVIVNMADCDHVKCAEAITRGLARNTHTQVHLIHTSGTGTLTHANFAQNSFGEDLSTDSKVYDDWEGIGEISSLPDHAIHRNVDKMILAASNSDPSRIKTAIVFPSCIYGLGRGPGNKTSKQVHIATQVALKSGRAIQVGHGTNYWNEVHIHDLTRLYLALVQATRDESASATWNDRGLYLAESGSFTWTEVIKHIAEAAHQQGYLSSARVEHADVEESKKFHSWYPFICATTSRARAVRARKLLGWAPAKRGLLEEIPNIVRHEAATLGLHGKGQVTASVL